MSTRCRPSTSARRSANREPSISPAACSNVAGSKFGGAKSITAIRPPGASHACATSIMRARGSAASWLKTNGITTRPAGAPSGPASRARGWRCALSPCAISLRRARSSRSSRASYALVSPREARSTVQNPIPAPSSTMRPSYGSASSQSTARSSSPCHVAPPSGPRSYGARFKYHASSSSGFCGGGKSPSRAGTPLSPTSGAPAATDAVGVGASGIPTGGCEPSARRRRPSFSFAFRYG